MFFIIFSSFLLPISIFGDNLTTTEIPSTTYAIPITYIPPPNSKICFDEIVGCFTNRPPYDNVRNLPIPPSKLNFNATLTRTHSNREDVITYPDFDDTIKKIPFDETIPLKIIVHGFSSTSVAEWVTMMENQFHKNAQSGKYYILKVDWTFGAMAPDYMAAVANSRLVGKILGLVFRSLQRHHYLISTNIHCIGHSLGAHVCGYASYEIHRKVGRITGLDPAGPNFQGEPPLIRLDPDDAYYVDVIHSNAGRLVSLGTLGYDGDLGDSDFYPNGGHHQPNCDDASLTMFFSIFKNDTEIDELSIGCSHALSHDYFIESINGCQLTAFPCDSWESYLNGRCSDCNKAPCGVMGYYSDQTSTRGSHYLQTNIDYTICGKEYLATVHLDKSTESDLNGHILMSLANMERKHMKAASRNSTDKLFYSFIPGDNIHTMLIVDNDHQPTIFVDIELFIKQGFMCNVFGLLCTSGEINIDYVEIKSIEDENKKYYFCEERTLYVGNKTTIELNHNNCHL
ncbi:hypothetical protein SNEBB_002074 [Seison nebaliae]|nr:hypothetical protein SNEBB_002074 [Seison nebaliae]